ncbi:polyketide synthase dehydratase domain-containing protein [Motilimonas pumila]|uniref:PKS/mFAS DH domain-containing protein n=1 Tax=Motilimonas pumila TaxID=2303987 RepID=A0A418YII9_9GAMM|nr:polyketide synthase dehydratase domain-containing protein [Motilimonas pumila]RJG50437.1 hypothetical protein D1Z90_02865 [Motilimonas pumila]
MKLIADATLEQVTDRQWQSRIMVDLKQHRYLLSHQIAGQAVIPSVFLLEMALQLLQPVAKWPLVNTQASHITAPRFAVVNPEQPTPLTFLLQQEAPESDFLLTVLSDKRNRSGKTVRQNIVVLTAKLAQVKAGEVSTHAGYQSLLQAMTDPASAANIDIVSRATVSEFQQHAPSQLGCLFATLDFDYRCHVPSNSLLAGANLRNSAQYLLANSTEPDLHSPVLACMAAVQHIPFFSFLQGQVQLPSDIGQLHYLGQAQDGRLTTVIQTSQQGAGLNILQVNSHDLSPVAFFSNYQLVSRNL